MRKRPSLRAPSASNGDASPGRSRTESLVAIVDHCAVAETLADKAGYKFLAYLLAMTIQEARSNIRPGCEEIATIIQAASKN